MNSRNNILRTVGSMLMVAGFQLGPVPSVWSQVETRQANGLKSRPEALKQKREAYYKGLAKIDPKDLQGPDSVQHLSALFTMADLAELPEETAKWRRELYLEHPNYWFTHHLRKTDGWSGVIRFIRDEFCSPENRFEEERLNKLKILLVNMYGEFEQPSDWETILLTTILLLEESKKHINEFMKTYQKFIGQSESGKAVRILVQDDQSWENKLIDLDDLERLPVIDKYKQYLYEKKISPTSREKPLIAIAAARSYLRLYDSRKAEKAIDCAKKAEAYPDFVLAKAQILVEQGKYDQAMNALKNLSSTGDKSKSATQARESLELVNHHLSNRGKLNPHYQEMLKALTDRRPESVLVRVTGLENPENGYQAYVRVHRPSDTLEMVWIKDKQVVFAYRADPKGCASYFAGNKVIKKAPDGGMVLEFKIEQDLVTRNFGFFYHSVQQGNGAIRNFFTDILDTLKNQRDNKMDLEALCGEFSYLIDKAHDSRTIGLKSFGGLEKSTKRLSMTLDKQSMPLRFTDSTLAVDFLAWENRLCEDQIAALWPKLPVEEVAESDPTEFVKIMSLILTSYTEISGGGDKATKPAGEK